MQEKKLNDQLDDYENLISEFRTKMAKLRQHEEELLEKSKLIQLKEEDLNKREIELENNTNEENEIMLDRIKSKLEKINAKEKELEQKLNSEPIFKNESRITELENSKK